MSHLDVLPRVCKVLPKPTCQMLYNTKGLPFFNYCLPVWNSCGLGNKAYLTKLSRHATCIIEGRSMGAEELKSTLGWRSLQAHRNYLKCLLLDLCLHIYFQSKGTCTFSMAITPEAVICCILPLQKLLSIKKAL